MTARTYPDEPADGFPSPPTSFSDRDGREIELRPFDDGDVDAVTEMYVNFDPEDRAQGVPPVGEERVRNWLGTLTENGHNVVAWRDDEVVGHATLVPDTEGGYELAIFVHQDYQGAGIGTHLIRNLLGYGADEGVDKVWLTVERWNRPAVALYEKVGFEVIDSESFEIEMSIRLSD